MEHRGTSSDCVMGREARWEEIYLNQGPQQE